MTTTNIDTQCHDTESNQPLDEMSEEDFEDYLTDVLETHADEHGVALAVRSFDCAGLLTRNRGVVVRCGAMEFQLTVVRNR
jgi:hypothetical protein